MKKRIFAAIAAFFILSVCFAGCGCRHQWEAANCNAPKTCKLCQETLGNRLGHHWQNATCTQDKICTRCGVIGEAAPGHSWVEATTEAPKTCRICGLVEGDRIITDPRFTTPAAEAFLGTWEGEISIPAGDLGYTGVKNPVIYRITVTFGSAGDFASQIALASGLSMKNEVIRLKAAELYADYTAMGMDKEAADAQMQNLMGLTVTQYATLMVQNFNFQDKVTNQMSGVYYVAEGQAHVAQSWTADLTATYGSVEEGVLQWTDPVSGRTAELTLKAG